MHQNDQSLTIMCQNDKSLGSFLFLSLFLKQFIFTGRAKQHRAQIRFRIDAFESMLFVSNKEAHNIAPRDNI